MLWTFIIIIVAFAILGFVYGLGKGEKGAAEEGALAGAGIGCVIVEWLLGIIIPIAIIVFIVKSCS